MNLYAMRMSVQRRKEDAAKTLVQTKSHRESKVFRYIFEDSDFEDESYDVECSTCLNFTEHSLSLLQMHLFRSVYCL